ncbi:MAG TPA: hypothetical protein VE890_12110 [Thermoguttaceae bacterium]|nr:hypothetical protein [Thermoguttaceae bacterium]
MITIAKKANWIVVDRQGRSLEDDAASVYDQIHPRYRDFFTLHLHHAFAAKEVECIVRSFGDDWAPMQFWTMRPIVDLDEIVSVELTHSDLMPGDDDAFPWGSSLSDDDLREPTENEPRKTPKPR